MFISYLLCKIRTASISFLLMHWVHAKRVCNRFSSSLRPSPQVTEQCFQERASESLASFKKVQKSTFFYKVRPLTLANSEHHLGVFNLSFEDYKANFLKKDALLPSSQRDKMLENHPQEDKLRVLKQTLVVLQSSNPWAQRRFH